uniref:SCAN box domain-containing protein n=1 Tax=Oryzias latipes TaxID=8090 RepID=A0A3P9JQH9_ORYLA
MTSGGPRGQPGRTTGARRRLETGRARRPVPQPRMRPLEAWAELDRGRTDVYRAVRGVLRERRHNSPVTCCRRLRSAEVPSGRRPAGACGRRKGLCRGWEQPERCTEERIGGVAVVEQPQPVHPSDARTWVEEHEPKDSPADACRPTRQGLYIRGGAPAERVGGSATLLGCYNTGLCHSEFVL